MTKRNSINILYTKTTGDPFIDCGGHVIACLGDKFPTKNILELIEYATEIYVRRWGGKLHTFFLNSSITQPAFNSEKKIEETLKYYKNLIEDKNIEFKIGYCRISGDETKLYSAGRHNHMMTASGAFINFHSAYENGIYISKEALIRTFFIPLGVCFVGDKIALLQSNQENVNKFLVNKNVEENLKNLSFALSEGTLKSEFNSISNALFDYADFTLNNLFNAVSSEDQDNLMLKTQLNMYHFTNFGASPDVELHTFSNILFSFYGYCKNNFPKEWRNFINQQYKSSKFKDAQFDIDSQEWYNKKNRVKEAEYKTWTNPILNKLLKNISIIPNIARWSSKYKFSFIIVEIYCLNILKMDKYTIQKIKELSSFVLNEKSEDQIKKSITRLNGLKSVSEFRLYLLKLIKENYEAKNPNPLITIEDYIFYLFPDGALWKETRDLLLIAIYQKLHEENKFIAEIQPNDESDENE